mmetsp:Transcript_69230/g.148173  ORF Transcript_69230/g.148173 Transcript_69230/m.148173 type:complete len:236 (+) Transcript_69230:475-1182(+)
MALVHTGNGGVIDILREGPDEEHKLDTGGKKNPILKSERSEERLAAASVADILHVQGIDVGRILGLFHFLLVGAVFLLALLVLFSLFVIGGILAPCSLLVISGILALTGILAIGGILALCGILALRLLCLYLYPRLRCRLRLCCLLCLLSLDHLRPRSCRLKFLLFGLPLLQDLVPSCHLSMKPDGRVDVLDARVPLPVNNPLLQILLALGLSLPLIADLTESLGLLGDRELREG